MLPLVVHPQPGQVRAARVFAVEAFPRISIPWRRLSLLDFLNDTRQSSFDKNFGGGYRRPRRTSIMPMRASTDTSFRD
jgi:hypothetical protein